PSSTSPASAFRFTGDRARIREIAPMKSARRLVLLAATAAVLIAGCGKIAALVAPGFKSGSADFSVYAAMGTSISAGYESGGLVVTHQQRSFPWLFAHQVHVQS